MNSQWLAIDVATSPKTRARALRRSWERFVEGADVGSGVRTPIAESWQRSARVGVDPSSWFAPLEIDSEEARDRWLEHPVARIAPILRESLAAIADDAEHLIVVSDPDGLLLSVEGNPRVKMRAAEEYNFAEGARWSEQAAGTNAIGTALAADHAIQVFAGEHFSEKAQRWTCAAAPVRDPATGQTIAVLDLTARMETVHPHSLAVVMAAALNLENELRNAQRGRERTAGTAASAAAVPAVKLDVLGDDRARVRVAGREFRLSQRHSEILVLLATHPEGMTAEQLAIALYGDFGKPVTARAELSRLRALLGPCVLAEPYRLEAEVSGDLTTVRQLLRGGRVGDAATRYRGGVLPRSEAPGVVEVREELDWWMRHAVMASDELEALWAWLDTRSGAEDLQAWKRFLGDVPHEDGRRSLAAARVGRLRTLLETPA